MLVILSVSVSAFDCTEPYDEINFNNLEFVCTGVTSNNCFSYVYDNQTNGSLINVYPDYAISEYGIISGFRSKNGIVIGEFSSLDLEPEINYTFGVMCGNETYEFNRVLNYESGQWISRLFVDFKENIYWWAGALLVIISILVLVLRLLNKMRSGL